MANQNDVVQVKHLDSIAAAVDSAIVDAVADAMAQYTITLGTTPSTVEGSIWLEDDQ